MWLTRFGSRVPIGVQVGAVAALFVAALVVLWMAGASVLARERRRISVGDVVRVAESIEDDEEKQAEPRVRDPHPRQDRPPRHLCQRQAH